MQIKKIIAIIFLFIAFFHFTFGQFNDINKGNIIHHSHLTPNLLGGGVGIIDINNDGWEDVYLTSGTKGDVLLFNKGNLQFENISISSFIFQNTRSYHTNSVSIGDINNDGFDDIFLGTIKGQPSQILLNSGENTFQNITSTSGISQYKDWAMGSIFVDVNQDGLLDIYVINYISEFKSIINEQSEVIGFDHSCADNNLFINNGDLTFTEKTVAYSLNSEGCGLAVSTCDINNDGFLDIIVANDFGEWVIPNQLFVYDQASNQFSEKANHHNLGDSIYGMGVAVADVNSDQKDDFFITNIGASTFKISGEEDLYLPIDSSNGFYRKDQIGWGTLFTDVDNDGDDDLYVSNGFISTADFIAEETSDSNRLYINSNSEFNEKTVEYSISNSAQSRGSAFCDLNNDGLLDIINVNLDFTQYNAKSNVNLFINESNNNNHWVSFELIRPENKNSIGAILTLYNSEGTKKKYVKSGGSHASSSSKRVHFGLASVSKIDSLNVKWPDGTSSTFFNLDINKYYRLSQGSDIAILDCENSNWGCPFIAPLEAQSMKEDGLVTYPNPSAGSIAIKSKSKRLEGFIYNSAGQLIHQFKTDEMGLHVVYLKGKGIYFIKLGKQLKKIVVN